MKAPPPVLLPIHPHQFDRHDSRDWRQVNIDLASREVLKLNFQSLCSAPELVGAEHATQGPDKAGHQVHRWPTGKKLTLLPEK